MDDPRLSRYYLDALKRRFTSPISGAWQRTIVRPGLVPALALALLLAGLAFAYRERGRGHLHRLEAKIVTEHQEAPVPRPGGQEAIVLSRSRLPGSATPEFLSMTMLPGRGMNILQITAFIPTRGDVGLLDSPSLDKSEQLLTGTGEDANGAGSLSMGAPFEAPWAGQVWGSPGPDHITANWHGRNLILPAIGTAVTGASGLLLARTSDSAETAAMPDGGQATVTYNGDFGSHWPSKTRMRFAVLLSGRSIDLNITAQNTGDTPEPFGIGWRPRLVVLGDRSNMRLRIPGQMRLLRDRQGQPTGTLTAVRGTPYDFTAREGTRIGSVDLDDTYVQLHQEFLDSGPVVEVKNMADNFGLRMIMLSNSIKALHVFTKHDASFYSIDPQSNYDDPFGREWNKDPDAGMIVLAPGQTTQWRVRLELFSISGSSPQF